jgi:hypothetical protein
VPFFLKGKEKRKMGFDGNGSAAMEDRGGTRWEIVLLLLPCQKGGESNKPRSGSLLLFLLLAPSGSLPGSGLTL